MALAVICLLALLPSAAVATVSTQDELEDMMRDELGKYDLSEWESSLPDDNPLFGDMQLDEIVAAYLEGDGAIDAQALPARLLDTTFTILHNNIGWMLLLVAIAVSSGIADALMPDDRGSLREVVRFVTLVLAAGVITAIFSRCCALASDTLRSLAAFSEAAAPVLALMLTATGATASSGIISPLMTFLSSGVISVVCNLLLPIVLASGAVAVCASISGRLRLAGLMSLLKSAAKWMLGITTTVFLGTVSIRSLVAASYDRVSIRTAKYLLDKGVPLAGGILSGTFDSVLYCASMIKTAAGAAAVLIAAAIIAAPIINLLACLLTMRVTAAICEPISGDVLSGLLTRLADCLSLLIATLAIVGAMFMITVGLAASLGGGI